MPTNFRNPAKWLLDMFKQTNSGEVTVSSVTMLASPAIWYSINTISGDVGKMPFEIRRLDADGGHEVYTRHHSHGLFTQQTNAYQTPDIFKEVITSHSLGWGNGRAAIIREGTRVTELLPMLPDRTATYMVEGEKYHVTWPDIDDPILFRNLIEQKGVRGLADNSRCVVLHDDDVLHVQGFGYNGWEGLSIAEVLADAIGAELQANRYARNQLKNGFAGELMLEAPVGLFRDEDDAQEFLKMFRKAHKRGLDGESIGLLREGIKANVMNMSPSDSQFIEQREFSRQDVMLIFGLQHIPGDNSASSYNSLEQKQLSYLASCLDRWLVRWENQCDMKLLSQAEKRTGKVVHKFDRATWLRTDALTQQEYISGLISSAVINRNEARAMIDMNPVEDGDEFFNPYTTSGDDMDQSQEVEEDNSEDLQEEETELEANASILDDRIDFLVNLEADRINEMVERKDFLDQIDGFYTKWAMTLLNNNIPADRVMQITKDHKNGLLELAGRSTSLDALRSATKELTATWR